MFLADGASVCAVLFMRLSPVNSFVGSLAAYDVANGAFRKPLKRARPPRTGGAVNR
jgi:hypothetical protein